MAEMIDGTRPADQQEVTGLIAWFARNHVAANLLMFFIILLGLYSLLTIKRETFPEVNTGMINVQVLYRGGAPEEVERSVVVKIEEAVEGIQGIKFLPQFTLDMVNRMEESGVGLNLTM